MIEPRLVLCPDTSPVGVTQESRAYPFPADHPILALVHLERPLIYAGSTHAYAEL